MPYAIIAIIARQPKLTWPSAG